MVWNIFMMFLVLPQIKFFFQLIQNYKTLIFEKALNYNFDNRFHVIFKHGGF